MVLVKSVGRPRVMTCAVGSDRGAPAGLSHTGIGYYPNGEARRRGRRWLCYAVTTSLNARGNDDRLTYPTTNLEEHSHVRT